MIRFLVFIFPFYIACHTNPYPQGKVLYDYHCANCHMDDGSGLGKLIPPLTDSPVLGYHTDSLVCLIRYGIKKNPLTGQEMPPNQLLNEVEMANLVNYLRYSYTSEGEAVKVEDIKNWLSACHTR